MNRLISSLSLRLPCGVALLVACATTVSAQQTVKIGQTEFKVADGWQLQQVADQPLVRYPIHADLAPDGTLYVIESSGSSAPVKEQQVQRPHRLIRLRDTNGDGVYDQRTLFADGLMLPQGVLWTEQGVLVATPPEIWRFQDTTGDGIADAQSVWFDGKTLTGCANDLHGPFLGFDGAIYWCKGAFAEQTYQRADGSTWSTRASHVFRKHPRTGEIESVMTGGMDNPVEFTNSLCGERFFTCTFIQHPADGRRDALVHSIYGGVYGKDHGVLDGHKRTGPLMPVMTHLGPAAPAGLTLRQATLSDNDLLGQLVVAQFNLQRVTGHQLVADGASLRTIDSDLMVADRPDFHPTDVLEDSDGTLLVIDTGGWYTLCCPTSHIDQSKATGGIYRLVPPEGKHSRSIDNGGANQDVGNRTEIAKLIQRLGDRSGSVRNAARRQWVGREDAAETLASVLAGDAGQLQSALARAYAVWAAIETSGRLDSDQDRRRYEALMSAIIDRLDDTSVSIRLIAAQGLGTYRYRPATKRLIETLGQGSPREQRYAAEALGRIGDPTAAQALIDAFAKLAGQTSATGSADSLRAWEHAIIYALIEIGPSTLETLRPLAADATLGTSDPIVAAKRRLALRVMDQLDDPTLDADRVLAILNRGNSLEQDLAIEMLGRRPAWDATLADRLPELLARAPEGENATGWQSTIERLILRPGLGGAVGEIIAQGDALARDQILQSLVSRPPTSLPTVWGEAIAKRLDALNAGESTDRDLQQLKQWGRVLAAVNWKEPPPKLLADAYANTLAKHQADTDLWLSLAAAVPRGVSWRDNDGKNEAVSKAFIRLVNAIGADASPTQRQFAIAALQRQPLLIPEQVALAVSTATLGPMELTSVLGLLRPVHDEAVNRALVAGIAASDQLDSLPASLLEDHFRDHPADVKALADPLIEQVSGDALKGRQEHMRRLLEELPEGDALRGFQVFRSSKAACSACHSVGYFGGKVGPDLTRINRIRTEQDLIEAIVYPSASFVRSYESIQVMTDDGRAISGLIANEDAESITLTTGIDQRVRVSRGEIEAIRPSPVSIMPAGLDQQLTPQELADLIRFLKTER